MNVRILRALIYTINVATLFVFCSSIYARNGQRNLIAMNKTNLLVYQKQLIVNDLPLSIGLYRDSRCSFAANTTTFTGFYEKKPHIAEKSKGKAFIFSMLIPGAGEYYVGRKTRARSFIISELALWITFGALRVYGGWIEDEYKVFARNHAGAIPENKKHGYFVDIGNFDNIYDHNNFKLNERALDEVYPETNQYIWQWDSAANRDKFERMRIRSDNAFHRALFVTGIIFVNHVVSAIDAIWITHKHNQQVQQSQNQLNLHFGNDFQNPGLWLTFSHAF